MAEANAPVLTLYNTATRRKEPFQPIDPGNVRMYVCGPTVYDYAHIGNARPVVVFDVLYRLLRHLYGEGRVTYARNITDVDDKIIDRARRDGVGIDTLTKTTAKQFQENMAALGCLPPTLEPRATDHIGGMIAMIEALIANGHAYEAQGHVLFDVPSWPAYGRLANRTLDEMIEGARVEVAPYKKDPMDFVLWKPAKEGEPGWESPWGRGRPGWHIECSAMSKAHLGDCFDIHGGGVDLVFPHHQNEVAQSVCAHGGCDHLPDGRQDFAQVWMHNGFLQVEGQKMSKSLGNFLIVNELLKEWAGPVLRLNMLMTHYRQPLDWTERRCLEARRRLAGWLGPHGSRGVPEKGGVSADVIAALADDLNTSEAFMAVDALAERARSATDPGNAANDLAATLVWLGLADAQEDFAVSRADSDDLRKEIMANLAGVNRSEIEETVNHRLALIAEKNWAEADRIRDELAAQGIQLKDAKDPETGARVTTWEVKR
ncbi:cysteine--tRNA ligase [Futiania mangrovi]|uniref:Cysteine--tRNA ligase n=1 Tax=Futiania mangrovi TaxID=2959716 RepID=A0A9J6PAY4_9PROT|nr:cysteine--tRNA ligase [Futiania mangrovii]MCP1335609.1 cysteine--tRNA ligase [Futiania mangrovii]